MKPGSLPLQLELFSVDTLPVVLSPSDSREITSSPFAGPDTPPLLPKKRSVEFGGIRIEYEFRRSKRRTIGFLVNESGLRVTAPKWATLKSVEDAIREKERWITRKLHYFLHPDKKRPAAPLPLRDGAVLPYLGRPLVLRLRGSPPGEVVLNPVTDELLAAPGNTGTQALGDILKKWFQEKARQIFAERLPVYAKQLGVRYRAFSLSSATQRWGSCSVSGNIRLNWRLVHFPLTLIDYVIAHELAHLHEMNHSRRFWDIVSMACPDYRSARKQLNEQGLQILSLF